jgi:hypothetical protein
VSSVGTIVVTGSKSGVHTGTFASDTDGDGGSFLPSQPFTAGETVTVTTSLDVVGGVNGIYQFTIATPAGGLPPIHWPAAPQVPGSVLRFHSRPDLAPAAVTITKPGPAAPGDIFLAPEYGPVEDGVEILDPSGNLIWFDRLYGDNSAADFRVQTYLRQPVLTWWQGVVTAGVGVGEDVIFNNSYQEIAVVHAGNGLSADLHEFQLTPQNTALITAVYPVSWNTSSIRGPTNQIVFDSVVQEIDIPTGLVLFQWDSLDHVPVTASYQALPGSAREPFNYFHVNSIQQDYDGNFIISGKNTSAAYKINSGNGAIMWQLGGKQSSFKMTPLARFSFQHDVRVRSRGDLFVTMFDDGGGGPPTAQQNSRGLKLFLNFTKMTATAVAQHLHTPPLASGWAGNFQQLPDLDDFVGWGQQPYFSEYTPQGKLDMDGHFVANVPSYRAYRFPWSATPWNAPALAVTGGRHPTAYASWNGATGITFWVLLGGSSPSSLRLVRKAFKRGFETAIGIPAGVQYVAVAALNSASQTLAASPVLKVP